MPSGQKDVPAFTSNIKSVSFPRARFHKWVISRGTQNTWGIPGCTSLSSLKSSTTVSIAAGGGHHNRGCLFSYNVNQSSGLSTFRELALPAPLSGEVHQEFTHSCTRPPDLSFAPSFSGKYSRGLFPFMIPSRKSPRESPSIPAALSLVPATCTT